MDRGQSPLDFDELFLLWSRKQSVKVAQRQEAGLILAGSGFCDAGPVLHHLQQALPNPLGHVVFTGHVLTGSMADALAHGTAKRVRINGQVMEARARVSRVEGFSGHASGEQLEEWLLGSGHLPQLVILNHGDENARRGLSARLAADLTSTVKAPAFQETVTIG
jgi:metallo-beta-lactamase family protein